ncbi:MAG: hypothetical protein M3176_02400 [Chloroflexota bacterium]|nr:hypothetical protein [Verrucomicrobiota bacterium]MDQ6905656.1 hypothetical protein [Chloroflexota bacterium]
MKRYPFFLYPMRLRGLLAATALCLLALGADAQTSAFTFQGKLNDNGTAASGNYDMQLKLYDTATVGTGTQVGTTVTFPAVAVTDGIFTVQPDFTANAFPGPDRFVEVGVKPAGSGNPFTILSPRQPITPAPYAMHSLSAVSANSATNATNAANATNATNAANATNAMNAMNAATANNATQLGGVPASQYVQTNDGRLSDARAPLPGSPNYIQNTTTQEAGSFNISLNGTVGGTLSANAVNSATQFNIAGGRVLGVSAVAENTYAGLLAGNLNTGGNNSFIGAQAGVSNTTGANNSFIGTRAGFLSTSTGNNSFVGTFAGYHNAGSDNTFVGYDAGDANTTGRSNTLLGSGTSLSANDLFNATAIGAGAIASQSNSLILGNNNVFVGIGTATPNTRLTLSGGTAWTSNGWTASMNLQNASALGWEANGSGQRAGIGHSGGGLYFFRTASAFGNTANPANYDMVITDAGDVTQPRDKGGFVKAMAYLNPFNVPAQYVVRSYNSQGNAITMTRSGPGVYAVDFGFDIRDRFISATLGAFGVGKTVAAISRGNSNPNIVDVYVNNSPDSVASDGSFYLFVY